MLHSVLEAADLEKINGLNAISAIESAVRRDSLAFAHSLSRITAIT